MKCTNCGQEFEGNFCPKCGTPATRYLSRCAGCGRERQADEKFCPVCGKPYLIQPPTAAQPYAQPEYARQYAPNTAPMPYAQPYVQPYAPYPVAAPNKSGLATFYKLLPVLPIYAFAVISVLLFAIFCAPVATLFGVSDNAYTIIGDLPSVMALVIVAVIGALFALYAVIAIFSPILKIKRFKLGSLTYSVNNLNAVIACVILLVEFIISCVICADVSSLLLSTGACPILVIVFALLLIMGTAAALTAEQLIGKKHPEIKAKTEKELFKDYEKEPVPPAVVERPIQDAALSGINGTVSKFERFKARALCYFCLPTLVIGIISSIVSACFCNHIHAKWDAETKLKANGMRALFIVGIVLMSLLFLGTIIWLIHIYDIYELKYCEEFYGMNGAEWLLVNFLESFKYILEIFGGYYESDFIPSIYIDLFIANTLFLAAIYQMIWVIVVRARTKKYRRLLNPVFYGAEKPQKGSKPVCQYSQLNKDYFEKRSAYKNYLKQKKSYNLHKKGHDYYITNLSGINAATAP